MDEFDEHEQNRLAENFSSAGQGTKRPSIVPSVTNVLANHGLADPAAAQRAASVVGPGEQRRPSIGPAVTEYLNRA